MRTADERKEAICWVLRHGTVGDTDKDTIMFTARFIGKITGLPLPMVFYYTKQLIAEGTVHGRMNRRGEHVYHLERRKSL